MRLRTTRILLSLPKLKLVAGGEEVLPETHEYTTYPEPIRNEAFELHPHESPSRDMDVQKEIHFLYRDLLKSIPFMKYAHLIAIPESQVRRRIRNLFEEGPKLRDKAAIRQRIINASADADEYFKQMMMSMQVLGKYFPLEDNALLKKDIIEATKPTQAASRFFNEGTNILLDAGVGHEDITENRVYIAREDAYRRGISKLGSADLLQHFSNGLDKAGSHTLRTLTTAPDRDTLPEAAIKSKSKVPDESAISYLERSELFQKEAGYKVHRPLGEVVQKAWEIYRDTVYNQVVLTHSAYKSLISDPLRHQLLRGPADWVRLTEKGQLNANANSDLFKATSHYYYSDQITDTWSEDLGVSYLADLKGVDRRLDFLLEQEIGFRTEHLKRIYVHTVESMKATFPHTRIFQSLINGENVEVPSELSSLKSEKRDRIEFIYAEQLKKHLDSYDWSKFSINQNTHYNVPKELDISEW